MQPGDNWESQSKTEKVFLEIEKKKTAAETKDPIESLENRIEPSCRCKRKKTKEHISTSIEKIEYLSIRNYREDKIRILQTTSQNT